MIVATHSVMAGHGRSIMRNSRRAILLTMLLSPAMPDAAAAESLARQWAWCREDDVEREIIGCSVVIRAGHDTPEHLARAFANRGRAWSDKGRYDRAIQDLNEAVRLDPGFADAFNYRGVTHMSEGEYEHAIADFDAAIRLDPNYAIAIYNRGLAFQTLGRTEQAAKDFATAKQVGPRLTPPRE